MPKEGQDAIAPRFLQLSRRMKDELEGSLPKGCAGGCLMVAVKVEPGWCPPLRRLSRALGVSPKALVQWEAQVLDRVNIQPAVRSHDGNMLSGRVVSWMNTVVV